MELLYCIPDTMDTWDQQKLEDVVEQKHGEDEQKNSTEIVRGKTLFVSMFIWSTRETLTNKFST